MDTEHAILAAVREHPHDETPRLVLADYYDDNDMPHEAAYHRGVVASRRAHAMTQLAGQHIEQHYGDLDGARYRAEHRFPEMASNNARRILADDPANRSEAWGSLGHVLSAKRGHIDAVNAHADAAYHAHTSGDEVLAGLHRQAAEAHRAVLDHLDAVRGPSGPGGVYMERKGQNKKARKIVEVNGVTAREVPGERVRLTVRYSPQDGFQHHTAHPAEFHATHEALE